MHWRLPQDGSRNRERIFVFSKKLLASVSGLLFREARWAKFRSGWRSSVL